MSLPYLPLYIDDYEAATAHLSMLEDGAYMRLLRLCWRSPGCKLPNDEAWIMRKLRAATATERAAVTAVLAEFFTSGRGKIWSKRLLAEHLQKSVAHQRRSAAGKSGGSAKAMKSNNNSPSNATALLKQPEPEPEPKREEREAIASPKKRAVSLPPDWVPSDRNIADAQKRGFSAQEIDHEADRFRDYHLAKGTTFKDWDAGWRTWLGNARSFGGGRVAGPSFPGGRGQGSSIASIVARRRLAGED